MAELLVKARDNAHPDPVKDRAGCYKAGDVVVVRPDGHPWGREEGPPQFVIVKLAGVPVADVARYTAPEMNAAAPGEVLTRRLYQFSLSTLPAAMRDALEKDGALTMTKASALAVMRNKATGLSEG